MLSVHFTITGEDGRVVSVIENNNRKINPNNMMYKTNDDLSSLYVIDQFADKVLDVRYANADVIRFNALRLRYNKHSIEIKNDVVKL